MIERIAGFKGMAPSVDANQLAPNAAQMALNCRLDFGSVAPLRGLFDIGTSWGFLKNGGVKSIFPYAGKWFNWVYDTDVCPSQVASDKWDRVYFTSPDTPLIPQYTIGTNDPSANPVAGPDYPTSSYNLGVPAPDPLFPPTADVAVSPATTYTDTTYQVPRTYVYTYATAYGEEGPPSAPSGIVYPYPDQNVDLTDILGVPDNPDNGTGYNITHKRIYRANTGTSTTSYQFVAEIPVAQTTFTDSIPSSNLGEVLASVNWDPPPAGLKGIINLPCGAIAGFYDNVLCFSEPFQPHAWPGTYQLSTDYKIVAIGAYGNNIIVATEGVPYVAVGSAPVNMQMEKLEQGYACISKRGMVDIGYAVIYPSSVGLMLAGMGKVDLVTKGILNSRDWMALNPASIHAYFWDGKYVAFWDQQTVLGVQCDGFIYDPATGDFTLHNVSATAGYHDPKTGVLYLVTGDSPDQTIKEWDSTSATVMTTRWKSKKFINAAAVPPSSAQIVSDGPVDFTLIYDGVTVMDSVTIPDSSPFRLPSGYRPDKYEVEISGASRVSSVAVADSMLELSRV